MIVEDALKWIEENNFAELAKQNSHVFEKVLKDCLNTTDERVLIIGDTGTENKQISPIVSGGYYFACQNLGLKSEFILQPPKYRGQECDEEVINAIDSLEEGNILLLSLSQRLGKIGKLGSSYRTLCKERQYRFASLTSIGNVETSHFKDVVAAINVDYKSMQEKAQYIKHLLDDGNDVHITTEKGTDFHFNIKGKVSIPNDGNYTTPGMGGNIPAGEVYTPPKGKMNVYGKVIIDGSVNTKGGTMLVKEPVTIEIEQDKITNIEGGPEARKLEETLEWAEERAKFPWGIRRIGELGIGINPNAKVIGATVIDEKAINTAHIAVGSNYWFGGTIFAIIHMDQVFKDPKIEIDGKVLRV